MTFDIRVPLDKPVRFPAVCMACGELEPNSSVDLTFFESSPPPVFEAASTLIAGTAFSNPEELHPIKGIPICVGCGKRLKAHHRRQRVGSYISWSLSLILAVALPVELWLRMVIFFIFLILPAIASVIYPPAFNVEFKANEAEFQFVSQKSADAFSKANIAGK